MSKKFRNAAIAATLLVVAKLKVVGAFVRTPNFLKEKIIKKKVFAFLYACTFGLMLAFPVVVFALMGPCQKGISQSGSYIFYDAFTNPGGSHLPMVDLVVASYSNTTHFNDICLNNNETNCAYTYGHLSFEETGFEYTYSIVNGVYKVTEIRPALPVYRFNRRAC